MRAWMCAGWLLAIIAGAPLFDGQPASGQDAAPAERLAARIQELVADLSSDQRRARLAAEQELLEIGPAVLEHLPAVDDLPHAAAREVVRRLRLVLERRRAESSVEASRVTWTADVPLGEAVEQLRRQTGNAIRLDVPNDLLSQPVTDTEQTLTFWGAVSHLEDRFQLTVNAAEKPQRALVLRRIATPRERIVRAECRAFRATLAAVADKPIAGRTDQRLLRLTWDIQSEPRLRPLFLKLKAASVDLQTAGGDRLPAFSPDAVTELSWYQSVDPVRVRMDQLVPTAASGPATIAFPLDVLVAAGVEDLTFAEWTQDRDVQRSGGVAATRGRIEREKGRLRIPVNLLYDAGGAAFESHRNWAYHNVVYLTDGKGRIDHAGPVMVTQEENGSLELVYDFPDTALAEWRLVYHVPTLFLNTELNFTANDAPLTAAPAAPTN